MSDFTLQQLEAIIAHRVAAAPDVSYTAKLASKGISKAVEKFGEEAIEAIIAAINEPDDGLVGEIADVLYHLQVVMHLRGISIDTVLDELQSRTAQTGLEEKASRLKS